MSEASQARAAAIPMEAKNCRLCSDAFGRHKKDSARQWRNRQFCSTKCSNRHKAEEQKSEGRTMARFLSKVKKTDTCWVWVACRDKHGYGRFGLGGRVIRAYRASWILHNGPIPEGAHVLHKCDNPPCVRPDHLYLGTHKDNMRDMRVRKRASGPKGTNNYNCRLTPKAAIDIYQRYVAGEQMKTLADEYGVTPPAVHSICWGRTWVDHTGAERIR